MLHGREWVWDVGMGVASSCKGRGNMASEVDDGVGVAGKEKVHNDLCVILITLFSLHSHTIQQVQWSTMVPFEYKGHILSECHPVRSRGNSFGVHESSILYHMLI